MAVYDPYSENDNFGAVIGDLGGKVISILLLMGGMGKGPLAGLMGTGGKTAGASTASGDQLPSTMGGGPGAQGQSGSPGPQQNPLSSVMSMLGGGQGGAGQGPPPPQIMQSGGGPAPQIQQPTPLAPQGGPPPMMGTQSPFPGGNMDQEKLMQMIQMLLGGMNRGM